MTNFKFLVLKNKYVFLEPFKEKHITNSFVNSLNNKDINKYLDVTKSKQTKKTALKYYLDRLKNKNKTHCNYKNIKKWDSLNHVNLILAIESKFRIQIKPEESIKLISYKEILDYLKKKSQKTIII